MQADSPAGPTGAARRSFDMRGPQLGRDQAASQLASPSAPRLMPFSQGLSRHISMQALHDHLYHEPRSPW